MQRDVDAGFPQPRNRILKLMPGDIEKAGKGARLVSLLPQQAENGGSKAHVQLDEGRRLAPLPIRAVEGA